MMKRILPILAGILFIVGAIVLVIVTEPKPVATKPMPIKAQPVSVVSVTAEPFSPTLSLIGTSSTRWQSELRAQSSAKLDWLAQGLEPGKLLTKGQALAKLDTTMLKAHLAKANSEVKQAELQLLKENHEQTVAIKMLSDKKSSSYARREPQIAAAKAAVVQAKSTLLSVKQQLDDARITAPYDAVILARNVSPTQFVEQGQSLFTIASSRSLDVKLPIPESQWSSLLEALPTAELSVQDRQHQSWPASIRYISPIAQNQTRQREVVLSISNPFHATHQLLPNQQVTVQIRMPEAKQAMQLPASALTRDGEIWCVQDSLLVKENIQVLEQSTDNVWVKFNTEPQQPRKVVIYPLVSMLPGQHVTPIEVTQ
ncbi:efflux RND transporter periplasmic adaptor subunit [Vibrio sp. 404]|uniref:Efflux RND transporter periplasmic adaptor subunit n=1 Tax=Vibrio marinisediminis TaxID=2758441 RepID=A0A7W2FS49_9VIBR|nr:efflux RND transporter periplasmic adaptor subunit [Vibrio marinisediminis]MBA5763182.1 efflux RND transporter periplasmic adaptor subunit [Vibrio marinisediminis]